MNESELLKKCRKRNVMSKPQSHHQGGKKRSKIPVVAVRHPALRQHEHGIGQGTERWNLYGDENRKSTNHRKIRLKVEKLHAGAETLVVAMKFL